MQNSMAADRMDWNEMALVGRIARAHGIRGQVIVNLDTDFPETRFQPGAELFIERAGRIETLRLTTVRFQQERPVVGIDGVTTMTEAEALAGAELRVPVDWLAPLPPETVYRRHARRGGPRPPRLTARWASGGGGCAVRRRPGDGVEAGSDLPRARHDQGGARHAAHGDPDVAAGQTVHAGGGAAAEPTRAH